MQTYLTLHDKKFVPYLSAGQIEDAVQSIAEAINQDFEEKNPLFIAVLNGSFMIAADIMKKIRIRSELSFVKLASYQGTHSSGEINELIGLTDDLNGRHVIILEDIVDTGNTLAHLKEILKTHELDSLSIATLLLKPDVFRKKYPVEYVGINIPNKFVVGYGLDYNQQGRNLGEIYELAEDTL